MTEPGITRWLAPGNEGTRYSSGVRHGDVIYVSGQLGTASGSEATSFEDQLRLALDNLFLAVRALGGDRSSRIPLKYRSGRRRLRRRHAVTARAQPVLRQRPLRDDRSGRGW